MARRWAPVDRFRELLEQLEREHESQLALLRREACSLRKVAAAEEARGSPRDARQSTGSMSLSEPTLQGLAEPSPLEITRAASQSEALGLRPVWQVSRRLSHSEISLSETAGKPSMSKETSLPTVLKGCCPISPASPWLLYWNLVGLALICYDTIVIPLQAFSLPETWLSSAIDVGTLCFWSMDMGISFFTGYYRRGQLVMSQRRIAAHYARTWLPVDVLLVAPDWLLTFATSDSQVAGLPRLIRASRALRVLRLSRIVKVQRVVNILWDLINSEYTFIVAEMIQMMMTILAMNHMIACGWFLVGKLSAEHGWVTWLVWTDDFFTRSTLYQYSTCLHWALTQSTPASMDVVARNFAERVYSIVVLLFAMVAFSSVVGTVTSSMTIIRQMKGSRQKQFWVLRRYLKQHGVSAELKHRMTRFLEHQCNKTEKVIPVAKVGLLPLISDQLAGELAHEMHGPCLRKHPVFWHLSIEMRAVASRICNYAVRSTHVAGFDVIFSAGEAAQQVLVLQAGSLDYTERMGTPLIPPLREAEWLAEALLWTSSWRYRGSCFASTPCELLAIDVERFIDIMSMHASSWAFARGYGQRIMTFLNGQSSANRTDVLREPQLYAEAVSAGHQQVVSTAHGEPEAAESMAESQDRGAEAGPGAKAVRL